LIFAPTWCRVTDGLGNAIAGHPLNIRFIDARKQRDAELQIAGT
jgi:hypothetical protein